jgi:hypothetical protein
MAGDIKAKYGSSAAYTISLNSLASSTTWVAGRESTEVVNTTDLALDYLVGGKIKAGTSPTAGAAFLWVWGSLNDTPNRPDLGAGTELTGADAAATWQSEPVRNAACYALSGINNDTTTGRIYGFAVRGIKQLFAADAVPKRHGLFFAHSMVAALDASAGGSFWYTPVLAQYT